MTDEARLPPSPSISGQALAECGRATQGMSRADSRRAFKDAIQGVELPPIGRDDVDHARIALNTYISQWCAAGITAEVSELIHDLIRAAEVRGLNRGLPPASWTRTDR